MPVHQHEIQDKKLLWATLLNFIIAIAEIIGGIISNSLALISDALHNLGDSFAVLIAYIAHLIGKKPSNKKRTFGYKRIEILAAFVNAVILIAISLFLLYEAFHRLSDPSPVKGLVMFIVAVVGLLANLIAVVILHKDSGKNINVRAAYLHLIADTLSSVAVISGAILIYFFEIHWIDPVITILIGLYIIRQTWVILKQTVDILMQSTPEGIDLEEISKEIAKLPSIQGIHHVHAWNLDDQSIHFECHVDLDDDYVISEAEKVYKEVESLLKAKYNINHVTIQLEYQILDNKSLIH
jgi:cobalt-zinc-cadmium efflux system protein